MSCGMMLRLRAVDSNSRTHRFILVNEDQQQASRMYHHFGVQPHTPPLSPLLLDWCFIMAFLTSETASFTSLCLVPRMSTNGEVCASGAPKVSPNRSILQSPCNGKFSKNFP
mmetsp:Transcript_6174/g.9464  ORF Transcript_6174/g.9464 Transcript_6174/m.9464 type:complete len:112 (-) Transcript_6174:1644-1979(-)